MKRDRKGNDTVTIELPVSDRFMREISFLSRKWGVSVEEMAEMCLIEGVELLEKGEGGIGEQKVKETP